MNDKDYKYMQELNRAAFKHGCTVEEWIGRIISNTLLNLKNGIYQDKEQETIDDLKRIIEVAGQWLSLETTQQEPRQYQHMFPDEFGNPGEK